MATLHWYRGETYKFSMLLHDKTGAVISDAFSDPELIVKASDSTLLIPGAAETVVYNGQSVTAFSFILDDARLGAVPIGIHYVQLWGAASLGQKMIADSILLRILEGRA